MDTQTDIKSIKKVNISVKVAQIAYLGPKPVCNISNSIVKTSFRFRLKNEFQAAGAPSAVREILWYIA